MSEPIARLFGACCLLFALLSGTRRTPDGLRRRYPQGAAFAHPIGYASERPGETGIERVWPPDVDLPGARASGIRGPRGRLLTAADPTVDLGRVAIGRERLLASPLQMAQVAATVARDVIAAALAGSG